MFYCWLISVLSKDLANVMVKNALKIVLKGDQGVGKTTIAAQFAEKIFDIR